MDRNLGQQPGLIEIKCPKSKKSVAPADLLKDKSFYVELKDGQPKLKESHEYYSQIQMAMGLSGVSYCDFVVYTFAGLIIARTPYDHDRFLQIMLRINSFYKQYMLPKLCGQDTEISEE